jgi:hypothetical protein
MLLMLSASPGKVGALVGPVVGVLVGAVAGAQAHWRSLTATLQTAVADAHLPPDGLEHLVPVEPARLLKFDCWRVNAAMLTPADYVQRSNRINDALAKHDAAGAPITKHLVTAGDEAVDALKILLEDKSFWEHLSKAKPADDKSEDPYSTAVTKYHAAVLKALGYQPPPPAEQLADDVAKAIVAKRGAEPLQLEQVRERIAELKDNTSLLVAQARLKLRKQATPQDSRTIAQRLKNAVKATKEVILVGAALVGVFVGPLFPRPPAPPPPAPPPIVIVVPNDQLPPELRQAPPGADRRGPIYFYKALPPPDAPPGPPTQPRKTWTRVMRGLSAALFALVQRLRIEAFTKSSRAL